MQDFLGFRESIDNTGIHPKPILITVESMVRIQDVPWKKFIRQKVQSINELDKYTDKNFGLLRLLYFQELGQPGLDSKGQKQSFKFMENVKLKMSGWHDITRHCHQYNCSGAFVDIVYQSRKG